MYGTKTWSQFLNFEQVSAWGSHKQFFVQLNELYNFAVKRFYVSLKIKKDIVKILFLTIENVWRLMYVPILIDARTGAAWRQENETRAI